MRRVARAAVFTATLVAGAHGLNWLLAPLVDQMPLLRLPGLATVVLLAPGLIVSASADPRFDLKGNGFSSPWFVVLMLLVNLAFWFGLAWMTLFVRSRIRGGGWRKTIG